MIASAHPKAIVLREKDLSEKEYEQLARQVMQICQKNGTQCILHSFSNVAIALGAVAVHMPLPLLQKMTPQEKSHFQIIGASCHSLEEAKEAQDLGCTYITAGHKRSSIFRVKLIVSQIGCIIILVFPLVVHGIISQFYIEEKLFWNDSTYTMVLLTLFAMITLCALPMFFAFIFRDMGKTLTVSMVLFFVMIFLLNSESAQIISRIIPMGQLRLISLQKVYSTNFCLFVDFLWNFILYFIAGSAFLHTDLK